ncbi:MAG: symmetrical bis(5'-nucleosyl)-tetraphosphatase [Betaproteobacteria bacterium]
MANYLFGDVQGCDASLARLLGQIDFSPSRDIIYVLGDLVNRGPQSAAVLRRLMRLGDAARCVLGNHDLHLLAVAYDARKARADDTLDDVLGAPDRSQLLQWLRQQRLALFEHGCLMVHAGVLPDWTVQRTLALAGEVEAALRGPGFQDFLLHMYGSRPAQWDDALQGADRTRVIVNALTRMRFCSPQGVMEFSAKEGAAAAPAPYLPWFDVPHRQTANVMLAFGHWSALGLIRRDKLLGLDTGCVWGGSLSAVELGTDGQCGTLFQVPCPQAQVPGK